MSDKDPKPQPNAQSSTLNERRAELERLIADCEAYLRVAKEFTSDEEKWRTVKEIEKHQRELAALQEGLASSINEKRSS